MIDFPDQLARILARADFRGLSASASVRVVPDLSASFQVSRSAGILLHPGCAANAVSGVLAIRHALELLLLRRLWPSLPALAGVAAARTAALFAIGEGMDGIAMAGEDHAALTADVPPGPAQLRKLWSTLACHQPGVDAELPSALSGMLSRVWPVLGPAEWLMQTGRHLQPAPGDSISERGYGAAEIMRQALLADIVNNAAAVAVGNALANVRGVIRTAWGLPPGTFVALAHSSAEAELIALAAAQGHPDCRPVTMVLMSPAEIDDGTPVVARGRHPGAMTARGVSIEPSGLIDGYRDDTEVCTVALRDGNGAMRAAGEIAAECGSIAAGTVAAGRRVVLHRLDTSRTGLLAPLTSALAAIQERHPGQVDVVVDASQARLSPSRVWEYLALGWIVMLSGSTFLAGPQHSAAVLVPETMRDRFAVKLPAGLRDYCGRAEWPPSLAAVTGLPPGGDAGLALRWAAALAELNAFSAVPPGEQHRIMSKFGDCMRSVVAGSAGLLLIDTPPPSRPAPPISAEFAWNGAGSDGAGWDGAGWDETQTIISFALRDPAGPGCLPPQAARQVYNQLQGTPSGQAFALGPPVTIAVGGRDAGVLSIAASTRLVSAEPSHAAASADEQLARAIRDAEILLGEVSHRLRQWPLPGRAAVDGPSI